LHGQIFNFSLCNIPPFLKGQLDISLNLKKKQGENKMWNRIKNTEGKYKYDIDSIIDEQIKFYSKLFTTEGGMKSGFRFLCMIFLN
jgi:hypothetical protein